MREPTTTYYLALPKAIKDDYNLLVVKGYLSKAVMANRLRQVFIEELERAKLAKLGTAQKPMNIFGSVADTNSIKHLEDKRGVDTLYNKSNMDEAGFTQNFSESRGLIEDRSGLEGGY